MITTRLKADEFYSIARRFVNGAGNMSPYFDKMDSKVIEWKDRQFGSEGMYMGRPWKPLSSSTIQNRLALGFGAGPILQRTGKLKSSIKMVFKSQHEARWKGTADYYQYHQLGTSKMPARPMLGWNAEMERRAVNELKGFIILLLAK